LGDGEGEREYKHGNMFMQAPTRYSEDKLPAKNFTEGWKNLDTQTYDSTLISIWRTGGSKLRMTRLKDTIIDTPPLESDQRFYMSHSGNAIFFLCEKDSDTEWPRPAEPVAEYEYDKAGNALDLKITPQTSRSKLMNA